MRKMAKLTLARESEGDNDAFSEIPREISLTSKEREGEREGAYMTGLHVLEVCKKIQSCA